MSASIWSGSTVIGSTANADNSYLQQQFTAPTEGQTLFPLTAFSYAVGTNSLEIFINGDRQAITRDFTETSTTSFTLTSGVRAVDIIDAVGLVGSINSTSAAASASLAAASAAAAQAAYLATLALSPASLPLVIANGGTGQITKAAAFLALAPAPVAAKVLGSTDGLTFSMVSAGISTVTNIVTDTTLTAATIGYHATAVTSIGRSVTLPDATTLIIGSPKAIIDNSRGGYPVAVRDSTGVLIMAVAAGGEGIVSLKDNSTAAGIWSVTGTGLEPGILSIDSIFSSTYSSTLHAPFVALDANKSIHFLTLAAGGLAAFVVDNITQVVGTPISLTATASSVPKQCFKITATTAVVFYGEDVNNLRAVVLTLTAPTTLAVGTAVNKAAIGAAIEDFLLAPKITQLDANHYLVSYATATGAGTTSVAVLEITAGTTATWGASVDIIAANNCINSTITYALTAATALVIYKSGAAAPFPISAVVVSIAGTVPTIGTPVVITNITSSTPNPCSATILSATKAIVADDTGGVNVRANVITIAGTIITAGTSNTIEAVVGGIQYSSDQGNRYTPHIAATGANAALIEYVTAGVSSVVAVTEAAGVLTKGTIVYNTVSGSTSPNREFGVLLPQGSSEFIAVKLDSTPATASRHRVTSHKISGTVITAGGIYILPSIGGGGTPDSLNTFRLTSGDYIIAAGGSGVGGIEVLRSNGDAIQSRGSIKVPMIFTKSNPLVGTQSNRLVLLGSCGFGPVLPSSVIPIRVLNLEIAA